MSAGKYFAGKRRVIVTLPDSGKRTADMFVSLIASVFYRILLGDAIMLEGADDPLSGIDDIVFT